MLDKSYIPSSFEKGIFSDWERMEIFKAKVETDKPPFCVVLPPPNITSKLHVGHALNGTLQDVLIRYKKMCGFSTLFQPGTDHAAIATESKIVSALLQQGIKKEDMTREQFLVHAWEWYNKYNDIILTQFKALGLGCDWSRLAFTMDEHCSLAVRTVFVNLYNEGMVYKGDRMTNWCPHCMTALSDIEVQHVDNSSKMYYIKYPYETGEGALVVATTRPETMMGDVAIAVNAKDVRYKHLIGKNVILPILNKVIPILSDHMVDMAFGTGAVKITPAHDANDYEVALRHGLPIISIISKDGRMTPEAGDYANMDRFDSRKAIVERLRTLGLLVKEEKYVNSVGHCERCNTIIEPAFTKQWYVKMAELAKPAVDCVKSGELTFHPARMKKVYLHWMENVHDWCISRQLWSGHQIPVYTCDNGHEFASIDTPTKCAICGSPHLTQETDVLDTWFSSALWPMSTLGYPNDVEFLDYFYPTSVMVTAYEIIFLWVARMIFSGLKHKKQIPFKQAFIHGIVRDDQGRKMSKNLGNGIDPVDVIDRYGTDALRFSMVYNLTLGADSRYSMTKAEHASVFLNKLYNAGKFVLSYAPSESKPIEKCNLSTFDTWILDELNKTISSVTKKLDRLDIGSYTTILYDFVWSKFCDKYIELSKVSLKDSDTASVMTYVYTTILQLLHPIVPFITERIYKEMPNSMDSILMSTFPKAKKLSLKKEDLVSAYKIFELISDIRSMRGANKIGENIKVDISIKTENIDWIKRHTEYISKLCLLSNVRYGEPADDIESYIISTTQNGTIYIKNPDFQDLDKLKDKLIKELEKINAEIERSTRLLNNTSFVSKAPDSLIVAEKEKISKYTALQQQCSTTLEKICKTKN